VLLALLTFPDNWGFLIVAAGEKNCRYSVVKGHFEW
jgi:hypothetical protein